MIQSWFIKGISKEWRVWYYARINSLPLSEEFERPLVTVCGWPGSSLNHAIVVPAGIDISEGT